MPSQKLSASRLVDGVQPPSCSATISGEWLVLQAALSALLVLTLMMRTGLVVRPDGTLATILGLTIVLAGVRFAARNSTSLGQRRAGDFAEYALLFFGTGVLGVVASYPAAVITTGLSDATLEHVDQALHFNWLSWYRLVSHHASLQLAGAAAYATIFVSPMVLLGYLAWTQQRFAARRFLVTFWVAGILTLALFPLFPAEGPLAFLWHGPVPYMPASGLYEEQLIPALRAHQLAAVDMGALRGIVSAPSFHTVSAVLFIAAAWSLPRLRWPMIGINAAMLLAIPIEGTHYLADMIIGALVAIVAIVLVRVVLLMIERGQRGEQLT